MEPNTQTPEDANVQPVVATPSASPKELPKSRQILNEAWTLYKDRFWTLQKMSWLPVAATTVVALVLAILALTFILLTGGFDNLERLVGVVANPLFYVPAVLVGLPLILALVLFNAWCQIALIHMVGKGESDLKQALMDTRGKIFPYYWVSILATLVIFGGLVLLIVPGIYLAIALSLVLFVLVLENEKGLNALIKSREYARGNMGRIIWYGLYTLIIIVPVYLAVALLDHFTKDTPMVALADAVSQITSLVLAPLILAYGYRVYEHIKLQKSSMVFAPTINTRRKYAVLGVLGLLAASVIFMMLGLAAVLLGAA